MPPRFIDPPDDLPAELEFVAEGARDDESLPSQINPYKRDAFAYFEVRDMIWLVTGIAGFVVGLSALAGSRLSRLLAPATLAFAIVSVILIALVLIWPPDYIEVTNDFYEEISGQPPWQTDYDLPFGREIGGWIGLSAALGVALGAGLVLRGRRS